MPFRERLYVCWRWLGVKLFKFVSIDEFENKADGNLMAITFSFSPAYIEAIRKIGLHENRFIWLFGEQQLAEFVKTYKQLRKENKK